MNSTILTWRWNRHLSKDREFRVLEKENLLKFVIRDFRGDGWRPILLLNMARSFLGGPLSHQFSLDLWHRILTSSKLSQLVGQNFAKFYFSMYDDTLCHESFHMPISISVSLWTNNSSLIFVKKNRCHVEYHHS